VFADAQSLNVALARKPDSQWSRLVVPYGFLRGWVLGGSSSRASVYTKA
jgi:hypothetical protein